MSPHDRNGRTPEFRRVVSVCAIQDLEVWRVTAPRVLKCIEAAEYILVCPDAQIPDFTAATPSAWRILGDDHFADGYGYGRIRDLTKGITRENVGWLFQQFLKINALVDPELNDEDPVLIWDADTVPLRKVRFADGAGGFSYFWGIEHHAPYFRTLERLLGIGRQADRSFIAQCFPTKVGWVRAMTRAIAGDRGKHYLQVVLEGLPGEDTMAREFSEYETMGSWNRVHHPEAVRFMEGRHWYRHGSSLLGPRPSGPLAALVLWFLSWRFDYVAFEKWEERLPVRQWVMRILRKITGRVRP